MNGYLVLLRHTMDDLPVKLCATRKEAVAFAKEMSELPSESLRKVFNTDCSSPVNVCVVRFARGEPVACDLVRLLDRDDEAAPSVRLHQR